MLLDLYRLFATFIGKTKNDAYKQHQKYHTIETCTAGQILNTIPNEMGYDGGNFDFIIDGGTIANLKLFAFLFQDLYCIIASKQEIVYQLVMYYLKQCYPSSQSRCLYPYKLPRMSKPNVTNTIIATIKIMFRHVWSQFFTQIFFMLDLFIWARMVEDLAGERVEDEEIDEEELCLLKERDCSSGQEALRKLLVDFLDYYVQPIGALILIITAQFKLQYIFIQQSLIPFHSGNFNFKREGYFLMIFLESSIVKYLYFCISCFSSISFIIFYISIFYWMMEVTLSFRLVTWSVSTAQPRSYRKANFSYYSHYSSNIKFYCYSFYTRSVSALYCIRKRCSSKLKRHPILSSFVQTYLEGASQQSQSFVYSTGSGRNEKVGLGTILLVLLKVAESMQWLRSAWYENYQIGSRHSSMSLLFMVGLYDSQRSLRCYTSCVLSRLNEES